MVRFETYRNSVSIASIGATLSGLLWGLYWMPLRLLESLGLEGAWSSIALNGCALLVLLPWIWRVRHKMLTRIPLLVLCVVTGGIGLSLFAIGIVLTDVVRATLLFYLSPFWATIMGLIVLKERLTIARSLAVLFGFSGAILLLGGGVGLPLPQNLGDWLALISGFTFGTTSLLLFRIANITVTEHMMTFMGGSVVVGLFFVWTAPLIGITALGAPPSWQVWKQVLPHLMWGAAFVLPQVFLTIWPARILSPGRVSLLLMSEVVVAAVTAAIFAGEHLGLPEIFGGALIVSAGLVDVFGPFLFGKPKK